MKHKIVYFHIGNPEIVSISIKQTRHWNPDTDIYLIGDEEPADLSGIVKFYNVRDLDTQDSVDFFHKYVNLSTNDPQFEKICIYRWFAMKELCIREKIESMLYLDSDIMVYCDLEKGLSNFKQVRYALSNHISPAVFCINDISVLEDYCRYVSGVYDDSKMREIYKIRGEDKKYFSHLRDEMLDFYNCRQKYQMPGGVCDMTFWGKFKEMDDPLMTGDMSNIVDDSTFDHNINASDFFETEDGIKKLSWENNQPYGHNTYLDKKIRFNSLHFQGMAAKILMGKHKSYE